MEFLNSQSARSSFSLDSFKFKFSQNSFVLLAVLEGGIWVTGICIKHLYAENINHLFARALTFESVQFAQKQFVV